MTTPVIPESAASFVGQHIGSYRLVRLLGEGGMGMVFQAAHTNTGGLVAVKILRAEVSSRLDITERFFNEAKVAASISHPGIVRVFDCGYTANGIAYLAMEFLEGESLRERLQRLGRLSTTEALRVARQIASALLAAHKRGVVHRDLKPDNVMLVSDAELPGGERAKVLDFGIAKIGEGGGGHRTRSGMVMGTPTYMAPEQCHGAKRVTEKSDVYSLGVILYEMLAGRPPFMGDGFGELAAMHLKDAPPPLLGFAPHVTTAVAGLVHSLLEKQESVRPSMEVVAAELLRALNALVSAATIRPQLASGLGAAEASPEGDIDVLLSTSSASGSDQASPEGDLRPTQPLAVGGLRRLFQQQQQLATPADGGSAAGDVGAHPGSTAALPRREPTSGEPADEGVLTTRQSVVAPPRADSLPIGVPAGARTLTGTASEIGGRPTSRTRVLLSGWLGLLVCGMFFLGWRVRPWLQTASVGLSPDPTAQRAPRERGSPSVPGEKTAAESDLLPPPPGNEAPPAANASRRTSPDELSLAVPTGKTPSVIPQAQEAPRRAATLGVAVHPEEQASASAWRKQRYEDSIEHATKCTKAQPKNANCWWFIGMSACRLKNIETIRIEIRNLHALDELHKNEIDSECFKNGITLHEDNTISTVKLGEQVEPPNAWVKRATELMKAGNFSLAMSIAKAYSKVDPIFTQPIIGKCACALGNVAEANSVIVGYDDFSLKNEIIEYCERHGFIYDAKLGVLKKK